MSRCPPSRPSPPLRGLAALCLFAASATAVAQGSTSTSWSLDLRTEDLNNAAVIDDLSFSGIGTNIHVQEVVVEDATAAASVMASNFPSVATGAPGPQLKSKTQFTLSNVYAGVGIRGIGVSTAGLADTYTVEAAPGYTGGFLRFHWGVDGVMTANLYSGPDGHLRFVNWEFHQQAELSASGPGLGTRTLSKHTMTFARSLTPAAGNFEDFIAWDVRTDPLLLTDEPELNNQEDVGGGGPIAIDIALEPGTPFTVDFQLRTAINMGLFNVDNAELLAGHHVDFSQTASLQGVQLLDADGRPYAGAWSLDAASGIGYTLLPVPEPGTWALFLAGLGTVAGVARRRRRVTPT